MDCSPQEDNPDLKKVHMLWHVGYWDGVETAVAAYGDYPNTHEKIYLSRVDEYPKQHAFLLDETTKTLVTATQLPQNVKDATFTFIDKCLLDPETEPEDVETEGYAIFYDSSDKEICIEKEYTNYTMHRLSTIDLEYLEKRHALFQQLVGYHVDHDPSVYLPYRGNDRSFEFYNKSDPANVERHIVPHDPFGKIRSHDIIWYGRP